MKIKNDEIGALISFLEPAIIIEEPEYITDMLSEYTDNNISRFIESNDFKDYMIYRRNLYSIITKCVETKNGEDKYSEEIFKGEIELSSEEIKALNTFIFCNFIDYIRKDVSVDNFNWIKCIIEIYEKTEKIREKERNKKK